LAERIVVMGLGNVLLTDDGAGPAALHRLAREVRPDPRVTFVDGGTLGLALLDWFAPDVTMILIDAVSVDEAPGTIVRLEGDDVLRAASTQLSTHQVGVADLLSAADQLDITPAKTVLVGVVPQSLALCVERSPAVEAAIPALVEAVRAEVERAGVRLVHRQPGDAVVALEVSAALGI
jgi:hydrogenase maturation protease